VRVQGRIVLTIGLLLVAGGLSAWWALRPRSQPNTVIQASGIIEATEVKVSSKVPGRIVEIAVKEGMEVRAGQVIARLDSKEVDAQVSQATAAGEAARARLAQAEAALRQARAQVDAAVANAEAALLTARARVPQAVAALELAQRQVAEQVRESEARLAGAQASLQAALAGQEVARANLEKARQDFARAEALAAQGAIAAQQVDAARTAVEVARAQFEAARHQVVAAREAVRQAQAALALARAGASQIEIRRRDVQVAEAQVQQAMAALASARAGYETVRLRAQEVEAARAQVVQAEANLRYLLAQRENLTIRAPLAGLVLARSVEEGEVVNAGTPIVTIADIRRVWIRLFIPEEQLARVKVGQPVRVFVDAFPGRPFQGRVTEVSSRAEFTPANIQTKEERVKLVFAVRVSLDNPEGLLKPGMFADAEIITGNL
jgi:HlyD family secretion protein